jgi:hypothetical protein
MKTMTLCILGTLALYPPGSEISLSTADWNALAEPKRAAEHRGPR